MSVILEAKVEGLDTYLKAKWLLLALCAYMFSSLVSPIILQPTLDFSGSLLMSMLLLK